MINFSSHLHVYSLFAADKELQSGPVNKQSTGKRGRGGKKNLSEAEQIIQIGSSE